ncbi:hypothetical protein AAG906_038380 [Vitis piasezkii]
MGGHGGLNILPQKSWNVYGSENRERVRRDEEAAARNEQMKREQSRKRDTEFRLERLRLSRGFRLREGEGVGQKRKKAKKEEAGTKVVFPENDKYRLGYGVGRGMKLPWYLSRLGNDLFAENGNDGTARSGKKQSKSSGKKTLEELRKERAILDAYKDCSLRMGFQPSLELPAQ